MYNLAYNSNSTGSATVDVDFSNQLENVSVQIDPGANSAYNITIKARLDAALPWQTLKTVTQADNPLVLLFQVAAYPHYQVNLVSRTGADPVKIALYASPDVNSVLTTEQPLSEGDAIA